MYTKKKTHKIKINRFYPFSNGAALPTLAFLASIHNFFNPNGTSSQSRSVKGKYSVIAKNYICTERVSYTHLFCALEEFIISYLSSIILRMPETVGADPK